MFTKNQYTWICGYHSIIAALQNNKRQHKVLLVTQSSYTNNESALLAFQDIVKIEVTDREEISALFPKNTAHKGIALLTSGIPQASIEKLLSSTQEISTILALDQITDTGNIGAILRSSSAFAIDAVIITKQHSPDYATLSKAASGTLESVPIIHVNNLANTISKTKNAGFWCYGMDERAETSLQNTTFKNKTLIVVGSEHSGLRQLTKQICDFTIKIPTSSNIASLNVASATAITLYSRYAQNIIDLRDPSDA